jgi:hypothetical protein
MKGTVQSQEDLGEIIIRLLKAQIDLCWQKSVLMGLCVYLAVFNECHHRTSEPQKTLSTS